MAISISARLPLLLACLAMADALAVAHRATLARPRAPTTRMSALASGDDVIVLGGGPVMLLAAKLAALRGFSTTIAATPDDLGRVDEFLYDSKTTKDSLPVATLPISGPDADGPKIDACAEAASGLIVAFDAETVINEGALKVFMREGAKLKRAVVMSRYLNGAGMGFFATAAKKAANRGARRGAAARPPDLLSPPPTPSPISTPRAVPQISGTGRARASPRTPRWRRSLPRALALSARRAPSYARGRSRAARQAHRFLRSRVAAASRRS